MRRSLIFLAVTALSLVAAAPATAGTLSTQNSCKWSYDGVWRHQPVELSGIASPNPGAPGSGVTLTQTSVRSVLPDYVTKTGYGVQALQAGENQIPVKVWLALEAPGSPQGVVVQALQGVARTTITETAAGEYASSTPLEATLPIPDTTWTLGASPLGFRQAGAGTLPPIAAGIGGANVQPLGSAYIRAEIGSGGIVILIDCQPATGEGNAAPAPFTAGPFETVAIDPAATAVPAPKAVPVVAVRTTSLKASGRKVKVSLSCTAANCNGALTLKAGSKTLARRTTYAVRSGARKTVTLTLSKTAQRSLKNKKSLKVSLRVTATGGKTTTKKLTLR